MYTVPGAGQGQDYSDFLYHANNSTDIPIRTAKISDAAIPACFFTCTSIGISPYVPDEALSQLRYRSSTVSFCISNWNSIVACPGPDCNVAANGSSVHLPQISDRHTRANAGSEPSFCTNTVSITLLPVLASSGSVASTTLM